jgi:hypothetical protein
MSNSESGNFHHVSQVNKWSEEQTQAAAAQLGIDPGALTNDHFTSLGFQPEESIHVDHDEGTVTHVDHDGRVRTLHIDEWNKEH